VLILNDEEMEEAMKRPKKVLISAAFFLVPALVSAVLFAFMVVNETNKIPPLLVLVDRAMKGREPVELRRIPPNVLKAFLDAVEPDFFTIRKGYWRTTWRCLWENYEAGRIACNPGRISIAVVGAIGRGLNKTQQVVLNYVLQDFMPKRLVLSWYFNLMYFGEGQYGIADASRHYFKKEYVYLTAAEAEMLTRISAAGRRVR